MPYARFAQAQQQLHDLAAIDYFFAKQFSEILLEQHTAAFTSAEFDQCYHSLIALSTSLRAGHSCLPLHAIADQTIGLFSDENGVITHQGFRFAKIDVLTKLFNCLALSVDDEQAIVFTKQCLYLRRYFCFEHVLQSYINEQSGAAVLFDANHYPQLTDCLNSLFPQTHDDDQNDIDWQKIAVANALNKRFSIIAGGPGTGKTYTVTKLLAALVKLHPEQDLSMALVAPTGKAAQRLSESINNAVAGFRGMIANEVLNKIPHETQTLHRLLGVMPNSPNFRFNGDNKLDLDVLLVDEVSMVDLPLMARLLSALPTNCRVILLGDAQQLPSVAAGSILADLTPNSQSQYSADNYHYLKAITGEKHLPTVANGANDHVTYLTHSRRFDGKGGIGLLANAVINGEFEASWQLLQQSAQDRIPQLSWCSGVMSWLTPLVKQYYAPIQHATSVSHAFALMGQFRILTPTRNGETGVEQLNRAIEQLLVENFPAKATQFNNEHLYHGKPIMISENDYSLGLYNGDIGLLWQNKAGHLMAMFEQQQGDVKAILPSRLPKFETVYAMTIHKTQGSEFDHVAMVLPKDPDNQLLSRELLYTGITRAKKQLTLDSNKAVWFQGVERKVLRYSGFNQ
nr:exodeoxyribonuclease V subunit alpha [Thalassotalea sp. G2M2-11]